MRSFEPPARLWSPWRAPSLPEDRRDLRAPTYYHRAQWAAARDFILKMDNLIGHVQSSEVHRATDALDTNSLRSNWRNREWRTIKRDVVRKSAPAVRGVPENRPRIRVSVLSRQRSDQKSPELRIPCVGYLIARGLGAPDADDDRRLSPEHRAPAIRTLSRSRFNCARRLTSSMLVSRRTVRLQTLLLTVTPLNRRWPKS